MMEWHDNENIMVTIQCTAYNHEPYIRQCLEGFVMQKTNFRFEAIVHDDASTDGTVAIIREYAERYPGIIIPIIQTENQYSKHDGSIARIMNEYTRGKYIALCEGDDYWIDPLKLQKQVDILDRNPNYGLVFTNVDLYNQCENRYNKSYFEEQLIRLETNSLEKYIINTKWLAPCSWLFRRQYLKDYATFIENCYSFFGDCPLVMYYLFVSKVYFMNEVTAVYRVLEESASHSRDLRRNYDINKNLLSVKLYYAHKCFLSESVLENINRNYYLNYNLPILFYGSASDVKKMISYHKLAKYISVKSVIIVCLGNSFIFRKILRFFYNMKHKISK